MMTRVIAEVKIGISNQNIGIVCMKIECRLLGFIRFSFIVFDLGFYFRLGKLYIAFDLFCDDFGYFDLSWNDLKIIEHEWR